MSEMTGDFDVLVNVHEHMLIELPVRDGVQLRPMQTHDAEPLLAIMERDPTIRNRVAVASNMKNVEGVHEQVDAYKADDSVIRYVIENGDDVVGLVSFWRDTGYFGYTPLKHTFGFGFFIDPNQRGEHLATDSVRALMQTAQSHFRVDAFIAFTEADNAASQGVLKSLGFTQTDKHFIEPHESWKESMWQKDVRK